MDGPARLLGSVTCMEIPHGRLAWMSSMDGPASVGQRDLHGYPTWTSCMDVQHGRTGQAAGQRDLHGDPTWTYCMDVPHGRTSQAAGQRDLHGDPTWTSCMDVQHGRTGQCGAA
eukprot:358940-Chlamydomonas_euryale.AAC.1